MFSTLHNDKMNNCCTSETISDFSVIIPTLNGAEQLEELLASFTIQTVKPREVLVVDSSSSDHTVEVAERYGAKVQVIARDDFDHGGTRTIAARRAQSDYLVFFTQDVIPAHRSVLENLVKPLVNDSAIGISYGRQLPCFDASDTARHLRFFNYPDTSQIRDFADRLHLGLSTVFASNSCAAYNTVPAGVSYTPRDFIPTNLFSTMSKIPTPCFAAISLSFSISLTPSSFSLLSAIGIP